MTSFFTTGGIRGGKKKLDKFYPRSFNMGIRKDVFEELGGFSKMRFGEDIDFSIRIYKAGYKVCLFPSAWVYHKRRTHCRAFYRQVYMSGRARVDLFRLHPGSLKFVHLLPACFVLGTVFLLLSSFFCLWALLPLAIYITALFTESWIVNGSLRIALLSIVTGFIQLTGYGAGFISAFFRKVIFKRKVNVETELKKHHKAKV
jgi:GT2 family glycosyltransferase